MADAMLRIPAATRMGPRSLRSACDRGPSSPVVWWSESMRLMVGPLPSVWLRSSNAALARARWSAQEEAERA